MNNNGIASKRKRFFTTNMLVKVAILSALAMVIQLLEIPLPLLPPWLKLDFSDVPALIGGFALGPIAGIAIEFLKNLLFVAVRGTTSMWVGEFANFLLGVSLVLPASLIYRRNPCKAEANLGMGVGVFCFAVFGLLINYFVLLPFYIQLMFGGEAQKLIQLAQTANNALDSVWKICLLGVLPFNLLKGFLEVAVTSFIYKPLSSLLKK